MLVCVFLAPQLGAARAPHLTVLIIAEQFRADYLDRYRPSFRAGGFERLLTQGAVFPRARYRHLTTLTAPNAAVLATGAYPDVHGIVADRWYDREAKRVVGAAEAQGRAGGATGISPDRLRGSTFADELRMASGGRSRIVAVADRPEPAVMLAGRQPLGCYWLGAGGTFRTSSYYADSLPGWVKAFNAFHPASRYLGKPWKALGSSGDAEPLRLLSPPDPADREAFQALYRSSPFAAEEAFAFARRAIEEEQLGRSGYPDLLILHLSAPARLALETGALSPLMRDMVLRIDRQIAELLDFLDEQLGLANVAVVFTATHGIARLPESLHSEGLAAGRVAGEEVAGAMNAALEERYGPEVRVEKYVYPFVYLAADLGTGARRGSAARRAEILVTAGEAAMKVPGVAGYDSPLASSAPGDFRAALRRSRHARRSGDLTLYYDPYFVEDYAAGRGTAPGSLYHYDSDVPLILMGQGLAAGRFASEADMSNFAPTMSALLGIPAPSSATGKILVEALSPAPAPAETGPAFVGPLRPKEPSL